MDKLKRYYEACKRCSDRYVPPVEFTEDDQIMLQYIHDSLNHPSQLCATLITCSQLPILIPFIKCWLKKYIRTYGDDETIHALNNKTL